MALFILYQLPGAQMAQEALYAKAFEKGDELRREIGPSTAKDAMGTETSALVEFTETDVAITLRQVPGPDRINPYQVIIHTPFRQNATGTTEGTKYNIIWNAISADHPGTAVADFDPLYLPSSAPSTPTGPVVNSVAISPSELMMIAHDSLIAYDIQRDLDPDSASGDWVRLQAKGPTGEISEVFRIQVMGDSKGRLGTADVAESEVRALSAPYLPNSLEKRCEVQMLKRASGDIYYCLLTNAAFGGDPAPPTAQFRNLFVGVFRVSTSVAVVLGNFSQKDDVGFRMLMESLGGISTLPIINDPGVPASPAKGQNPP